MNFRERWTKAGCWHAFNGQYRIEGPLWDGKYWFYDDFELAGQYDTLKEAMKVAKASAVADGFWENHWDDADA